MAKNRKDQTANIFSVFPSISLEPSELAPNACVLHDGVVGVWLYHADCLLFMDTLLAVCPDGVFDMIFADPPYFLSNGGITCHAGRMVNVDKGAWDKSKGVDSNHEFNRAWLSRCQQLLKPHGTLWVTGTHHVIYSVGFAMQQLGMKILNDITWEKPNPPPNLSCRYFTHSNETVIWAAKNAKAKHVFHYDEMRKANGGKQMKTVWTIPAPSRAEKRFGKHPTQKPVDLLVRMIKACTNPGDLVFDPFCGSATTGVAAIHTRRAFVGTEVNPEYVGIAVRRLQEALTSRKTSLDDSPCDEGQELKTGELFEDTFT